MSKLQVRLLSPERELFSGEANYVFARTLDGEIGILPDHAPLLAALAIAPVVIHTDAGNQVAAVDGGFLHVRDNKLILLAEDGELATELDARKVAQRLEEATRETQATQTPQAEAEFVKAQMRSHMVDK